MIKGESEKPLFLPWETGQSPRTDWDCKRRGGQNGGKKGNPTSAYQESRCPSQPENLFPRPSSTLPLSLINQSPVCNFAGDNLSVAVRSSVAYTSWRVVPGLHCKRHHPTPGMAQSYLMSAEPQTARCSSLLVASTDRFTRCFARTSYTAMRGAVLLQNATISTRTLDLTREYQRGQGGLLTDKLNNPVNNKTSRFIYIPKIFFYPFFQQN